MGEVLLSNLNQMKYFFHDFETGGFEKTSILTYYAVVTDENFNKLDEIELFFKPKDGIYKVSAEALAINHIDLIEHSKISEEMEVCKSKLKDFLLKNTNYKSEKLYAAGHNIYFDNNLLKKHVFPEFNEFFFRHNLDTGGLGVLLKIVGKLPSDFNISLVNLAKHYGINSTGAHNAKVDVLLTIMVLKCIIKDLGIPKNPTQEI